MKMFITGVIAAVATAALFLFLTWLGMAVGIDDCLKASDVGTTYQHNLLVKDVVCYRRNKEDKR